MSSARCFASAGANALPPQRAASASLPGLEIAAQGLAELIARGAKREHADEANAAARLEVTIDRIEHLRDALAACVSSRNGANTWRSNQPSI